mgnify:CR=1 FL=1
MNATQQFAALAFRRSGSKMMVRTPAAVMTTQFNLPSMATRGYRGDSGEATTTLSPQEEALLKKGKPIYDAIYERHVRPVALKDLSEANILELKQDYPHAAASASPEALELEIRRKRLIYRSKQRGWLEVDVLLGTWASDFVSTLNTDELDQFEDFVNMETIDIYNVITLRLDVPEEMKRPGGAGVVERIQEWARSSPLGKADPSTYKRIKESAKLI